MKLEFRLKKVLRDYGLLRHGVISRIAADQNICRHTVARPYLNDAKTVSLETLEHVCEWLHRNGVPSDVLPGALLGFRPSELWQAIAAPGRVQLYIGERYEPTPPAPWRWVSSRDNAVSNGIVGRLSTQSEVGAKAPQVEVEYVPFGFGSCADGPARDDQRTALDIAGRMRRDETSSKILIGSQRVNLLMEYYMAGLFGCKPFVPADERCRCPIHLVYRETDFPQSSCFGGRTLPGRKREMKPGIYYRDEQRKWVACPWVEESDDAGIVIYRRNCGTGVPELSIFGFSGRSTEATGDQVLRDPDAFGTPTAMVKGWEVGVHIIKYKLDDTKPAKRLRNFSVTDAETIALSEQVLKKCL